ncbi:MAG: CheR family methyltransferase, partial [Terriglobales bacterium]
MQEAAHFSRNYLTVPPAIEPISERDFGRFRDVIERHAGIHLGASRKALLVGRLMRRLRALGLSGFDQYLEIVLENTAEFVEMLDCVCTNETRFFREPKQFELFESTILPAWRNERAQGARAGRTRIWSAGCSTGEEPFTIAMMLAAHLPASEGWSHQIIATDISCRVLRQAQAATWDLGRASAIPASYLRRFMSKGTAANDGKMRAADELRTLIRFDRVNLKTVDYSAIGRFDAIFCRNVLIY